MTSAEDVLDNWEELDETKLTDHIHQIKRDLAISLDTAQEDDLPRMMIQTDDYYTNSYTQPSKPMVTILRRPSQQTKDVNAFDTKPKQPIKTLQQREAEYAKARLRILGSAKNPEDELEGANAETGVNSLHDPIENSRKVSELVPRLAEPCLALRSGADGVLRMPKGPDGTIGFNNCRR